MHEDLIRLDRIDRTDREAVALRTEAKKVRDGIVTARALLVSRTAETAAAKTSLDENRTAERALQRRLDDTRGNRASAVRILETGAGSADAAQRQLERCEALIDEMETEMLELLEVQDGRVAALARCQTAESRAREDLEAREREAPTRLSELEGTATALEAKVASDCGALPVDVRKRYQLLRGGGKWPVARIRGGSCEGCRIAVPPQVLGDIRLGRMIECHVCHRWLVPESDGA